MTNNGRLLGTSMARFKLAYLHIDYKAVSAEDMLLGLRVERLRFDESDFELEDGSGSERMVRV